MGASCSPGHLRFGYLSQPSELSPYGWRAAYFHRFRQVEMGSNPVSDMVLTQDGKEPLEDVPFSQEHLLVAHSDCIAALSFARGEDCKAYG